MRSLIAKAVILLAVVAGFGAAAAAPASADAPAAAARPAAADWHW